MYYSNAMRMEARSRIRADPELSELGSHKLSLMRCGRNSHDQQFCRCAAGAAMHCWPDLNSALSEVHRVIRSGGAFLPQPFLVHILKDSRGWVRV